MKKKPLAWLILGCIVCFLAIIIPSLSGSLWFLHALLGGSSSGYTVGYVNSFIHSNELLRSVQEKNAAFLPENSDTYNRFVYRKDERGEYIAAIPSVSAQVSVVKQLRAQSWHVQRIGWVIYAQRGAAQEARPLSAMGKTIATIFWERLPAFPRFIVEKKGAAPENVAFYIEEKGIGFHGVIHTGGVDFVRGTRNKLLKSISPTEASYVAIQRDVLHILTNGIATSVENKVSQSMHFTKTRPRILEGLLSLTPAVLLAQEGDSFAIGFPSTDERAAKLIHTWVHTEQGNRHPQRKAFYLPDKTLGYEYIPGVSNAYFALNKANNGCLPSEEYDERIYLCSRNDLLVLSNDETLGANMLTSLEDSTLLQRGVVQGQALQAVGLGTQFEKLEYLVLDEMIEFWADKKIQ